MPQKLPMHPDKDSLIAFGLGRLEQNEATAIESHLEECEACCETLLDLKDDTFIALVRQSPEAARTDGAEDPSYNQTLVLPPPDEGGPAGLPDELMNHPRYRIVELIGRGGMGDVYKAEHRLMNRTVALKVINDELVRNAQAVERFRREVQAAARLAHPNIVTAHDAEQAGGVHYLVMEYVHGTELSEVVRQQGPLDVAQACDFIRQAAMGLQHAQAQGMVHRDIKPHNLMVTAEGQVKILDFGLATLADPVRRALEPVSSGDDASGAPRRQDLTSAGTVMGTPDFISPEQAGDARSVDIRADIYSLGCTLYYLLAGRPPFNEGSAMERMKAHADATAEPLESIRADIPAELAEVVRRMMAKDLVERFQSPAEVADALAPFVEEHRTAAAGPARRARRNRRRWPIVAAAAAFLVAGVAAIVYVKTDRGTLVINSVDESVQLVLSNTTGDSGGTEAMIVDTISGSAVKTLPSGAYEVRLAGEASELELNQERFVLKRGGEVLVRVTRKAPGEPDIPAVAEKPDEPPAAPPETREELREFLDAALQATSEDEWKTFVAAYAPMLFGIPLEESRGLIELLAGLPEKTTETLLQRGYLRWKATSLDEERQAAVRGILAALLSRGPSARPEHTSEEQLRARLAQSDTGFIVIDLPDSDDQVVAWYLLDRKHEVPVFLMLAGSTPEATRAFLKPAVRGQVTALLESSYSELPPGPVARPETPEKLKSLLAAAPQDATDEQWRALLREHSPPLSEIPVGVGRELIQLTAGVPEELREALLREGYLKWRFRTLDEARQETIRTLYRQILSATSDLDEKVIDRILRMLHAADVGWAVVNLPKSPDQAVVFYILVPHSPVPIMFPVAGATSENAGSILSRSVYDQLLALKDKPFNEVPAPPDNHAQTRHSELPPGPVAQPEAGQAFERLLAAVPEEATADEWKAFVREYAPLLAEFPPEISRELIQLAAGLPGESRAALLREGYLKWPFRALDAARQESIVTLYRQILSGVQPGLRRYILGEASSPLDQDKIDLLIRLLESASLGFAVVRVPETPPKQVIVWYVLLPNSQIQSLQPRRRSVEGGPIMLPVSGATSKNVGSISWRHIIYRQILDLQEKPYSAVPSGE